MSNASSNFWSELLNFNVQGNTVASARREDSMSNQSSISSSGSGHRTFGLIGGQAGSRGGANVSVQNSNNNNNVGSQGSVGSGMPSIPRLPGLMNVAPNQQQQQFAAQQPLPLSVHSGQQGSNNGASSSVGSRHALSRGQGSTVGSRQRTISINGRTINVPPPPPRRPMGSSGISSGHSSSSLSDSLPSIIDTGPRVSHQTSSSNLPAGHLGSSSSIPRVSHQTSLSNTTSINGMPPFLSSFTGMDAFEALFSRAVDRTNDEILQTSKVILPKASRGKVGSSTFNKNRESATRGIEHPFGVDKSLMSELYGEQDGNDAKKRYIQDRTMIDVAKQDEMTEHLEAYDMDDLFHVFLLKAGMDVDAHLASGGDLADLFDRTQTRHAVSDWSDLEIRNVCLHQALLNRRNDDIVSQEWSLSFIKNSVTIDLQAQIKLAYDVLDPLYKGAVTYGWLLQREVFRSSRETIEANQAFLKLSARLGLGRVAGENVNQYAAEWKAVASRLEKEGELHRDAIKHCVQGLTRASVPRFKNLMDNYMLDLEKTNLESGHKVYLWGQPDTKHEIWYILNLAIDLYKSMCLSNEWKVPNKPHSKFGAAVGPDDEVTCFNCGTKNHKGGVKHCPQPKNPEMIKKNRDEFLRQKNQERGGANTTPNGYNRNKSWGNGDRSPPTNADKGGVRMIDGALHAWCAHENNGQGAWVTDHSTGYHHQKCNDSSWNLGSLAKVCPTHILLTFGKRKTAKQRYEAKKKKAAAARAAKNDSNNNNNNNNNTGGSNNNNSGSGNIDKNLASQTLRSLRNGAKSEEAIRCVEEAMKSFNLDF